MLALTLMPINVYVFGTICIIIENGYKIDSSDSSADITIRCTSQPLISASSAVSTLFIAAVHDAMQFLEQADLHKAIIFFRSVLLNMK